MLASLYLLFATGLQRTQKLNHLSDLVTSDLTHGLKQHHLMTHGSVILGLVNLMNKIDGLLSHTKVQKS